MVYFIFFFIYFAYLEVNNHKEHKNSGEQVIDVGELRTVEGLLESRNFVGLGNQHVEKSDNGSLVFHSGFGSWGDWAESFPDNGLADVCGDEEGNSWADSVSLLEHFIKHHDDDAGEGQLQHDEDGVSGTEFVNVTVHARPHIGEGLTNGDDESED